MKFTIEEFIKLCAYYNLSPIQLVWILSLYEGKNPEPEKRFYMVMKEWDDLKERNIIGRDGKVSTAFVDNALTTIRKPRKKSITIQIDPKLQNIIEYMGSTLRGTDHEPINLNVWERTLKRMNGHKGLCKLYFTWLWLFPTTGPANKTWEKLFGTTYTNVILRRSHEVSIKNFEAMASKFDIGIYILATYLFIKDHIKTDGQCFIPKMENYFKVQEEWYYETAEIVTNAEKEDDLYPLFDYKTVDDTVYNTHGVSML